MQRSTLRRKRAEKGLKVREAAKLLGISRPYLSMVEGGKMNPSLVVAIKIADLYSVDITEFKTLMKKDDE